MDQQALNIEFILTSEDIIAWNNYLLENSSHWKRIQKNKFFVYSGAIILPFLGIFALLNGIMTKFSPWGWIGVGAILLGVIPALNYLFIQHYWRNNIKKKVNELYGHGKDAVVGMHKQSFSSEGVHDITALDESKYKWNAIENIIQTDQYIFILIPPRQAFIIPKTAFAGDSRFNQFTQELKAIFEKSHIS